MSSIPSSASMPGSMASPTRKMATARGNVRAFTYMMLQEEEKENDSNKLPQLFIIQKIYKYIE